MKEPLKLNLAKKEKMYILMILVMPTFEAMRLGI